MTEGRKTTPYPTAEGRIQELVRLRERVAELEANEIRRAVCCNTNELAARAWKQLAKQQFRGLCYLASRVKHYPILSVLLAQGREKAASSNDSATLPHDR